MSKPYTIIYDPEGISADIYLGAEVYPKTDENGNTDYDIRVRVIRDVPAGDTDALEEDIRRRYDDYMAEAEEVWLWSGCLSESGRR